MTQNMLFIGPSKKNAPRRFLIADDSEFARKNASLLVSKLGGIVIGEATNGQEAVEQYARLRPDVVLMDITMPQMEGTEAVEKIVRDDPDAVIVMVSSLGHNGILQKAIALGAKHFITKPIQFEYAAEIVRSVLDKKP